MTISVTQLNMYVSSLLREDANLKSIKVRGEISNFTQNSRSGHCYFTLKDSNSSVKAVMFSSYAYKLNFKPENGISVVVSAYASLYERDGAFQLCVTDIERDGAGDLLAQYEKLKIKLAQEGLFDESAKRILPRFPKKIGVCASPTGAALQDVINVISRRYPLCELVVIPTAVQGQSAEQSICKSLECAENCKCDVVIIARGGGSFEDLNCFNSEAVARAVFSCEIPVISAVGHETDFTICDFVADLRAPTPSAAAEICVPDINSLYDCVFGYMSAIEMSENRIFAQKKSDLDALHARLLSQNIENKLSQSENRLSQLKMRLEGRTNQIILNCENEIKKNIIALESLNPMKVLTRGYAAVCDENDSIITSVSKTDVGKKIRIRLSDGIIGATVDFFE